MAPAGTFNWPDHQQEDHFSPPNTVSGPESSAAANNDHVRPGSDAGMHAKLHRRTTGFAWAIVVAALISSTFLYALDNTVLATVRPSMVESLGRIDMLPWISAAYSMTEVGSNPLWGKLNNQFDNKILYIIALSIFETGSAIIGSAPITDAVIVGRVLAGIGGSGIYVGTVNIMSAMTRPSERTAYLNYIGIAWSLGAILGPIIGGAFADSHATWRWAFYINIVIAALAAPACIFWVPPIVPKTARHGLLHRICQIDYIGWLLFQSGIFCVVAILSFGGVIYSWTSGQMIGLYVSTIVAWTAFSLQQYYTFLTVDRIFPLQFVGDWEMVLLFCWTAVVISNLTVTIYSLPLLFQFAFGDSPLGAAVWTLPFIGAMLGSGGPLGPVFPKFSFYKVWYGISGTLMLIAGGLMSSLDYGTPRGVLCGYMVIQGLGCGPIINLGFTVGQVKVAASSVGQVATFLTCAQMAALTITLGVATTVFINGATEDIAIFLPNSSYAEIRTAISGVGSTLFDQLQPAVKRQVAEAVARNIGKVFYMNISGASLGLICTFFMKFERVNLSEKASGETENQDEATPDLVSRPTA